MNPSDGLDESTPSNAVRAQTITFDALTTGPIRGDDLNASVIDASQSSTDFADQIENERKRRGKAPASPRRRAVKFALLSLLILVGLVAALMRHGANEHVLNSGNIDASQRFPTTSIPLGSLSTNSSALTVGNAQSLRVNGQLNVNSSIVLSPTTQPDGAVTGQLYYDQSTNELSYYDGSQFTSLLNGNQKFVSNLGGASGSVTTGGGVSIVGNTLDNTGVLTIQGEAGNVTLTGGPGLVVNGTTLSNSGLLSLGGQGGNIALGNGLSLSGNTLNVQTGIQDLSSATNNVVITPEGNGAYTIGVVGGPGFGTVASNGGTTGQLAYFAGAQEIENSLVSQSGSTITVTGNLNVTGQLDLQNALSVNDGGTGSTTQAGARTNLGAAASGANHDITSITGLTTALAVTQGGIGIGTLPTNSVLLGNGTSPLTGVTSGSAGECLVSTASAPVFQACPGVSSINTLTGALTIAGASVGSVSASGSSITINDATSAIKGLASFNSTNFVVSSGAVNTIQDINTSASPSFKALNLTDALTVVNGGTGLSTLTANELLYAGSSSSISQLTAGTSGECLISAGSSGAPSWESCPGLGGVTSVDTLTGSITIADTTGSGNTITIANAKADGSTLGIAAFNSTDFKDNGSGVIDTVQGIATTSTPTFTGLNLTNALSVTNGGTGAATQAGARTNLGAAASGANHDITSITGLTTALAASEGGTGLSTLTANELLYAGSSSSISQLTAGTSGECLISGGAVSAPSFQACPGVNSLDGLSGSLTISNTTGSGSTITIANAKADGSTLGIAAFNSTDFKDNGSGVIDTVQGIATTSTPTFTGLNLTNALSTSSGGTGLSTLVANELLYASSSSAISQLSSSSSGLCLVSNGPSSAPSFQTCPGANGVTSLDALNGNLSISNTTGSGSTITINDARADGSTLGIAAFNGTNFTAVSGVVNTVQNIATTSSPAFAQLQVTSSQASQDMVDVNNLNSSGIGSLLNLEISGSSQFRVNSNGGVILNGGINGQTINTNSAFTGNVSIGNALSVGTINGSGGTLSVGSTSETVALQGQSINLAVTSGSNTNTLTFATPSGANKTITIPNATGTLAVSASGPLSLGAASGNLTISDAKADGSTLGAAAFNSTDFKDNGSGVIDTVQGIATTSTPTFTGLNLTNALSVTNGGGLGMQIQNGSSSALTVNTSSLTGIDSTTSSVGAVLTLGESGGNSIAAEGAVSSNLGDYAEYFSQVIPGQLQPGDVACLNSNAEVETCSSSNSTNSLVGVVSTSPGFVGNNQIHSASNPDNTALISMVGQVPVHASSANGAIQVGDMLTFDPSTGLAVKATSAGMTIGEALEGFNGSTGTIQLYIHISYYDPMGLQSNGVSTGYVLQGNRATLSALTVTGNTSLGNLVVNGSATITNLNVTTSLSTAGITINGHIITKGSTPATAIGSAAGSGASTSVVGNDTSGKLVVTLGEGTTTGELVGLTFAQAYGAAPNVVVTAGNSNAALIQQYITSTTTGFSLSAATADNLTSGQTYTFYYHVLQ